MSSNRCYLCGKSFEVDNHPEFTLCQSCFDDMTSYDVPFIPRAYLKKKLRDAKSRAKKHNLEFNLDLQFLEELVSSKACMVTAIPYNLGGRGGSKVFPFMPAIDRIDPSKGYTKDNCRLVCNIVNTAKLDWPDSILGDTYKMIKMLSTAPKQIALSRLLQSVDDMFASTKFRDMMERGCMNYFMNEISNNVEQVRKEFF